MENPIQVCPPPAWTVLGVRSEYLLYISYTGFAPSSFIMCYNTVKPLSLLTPPYNKQFFCKDTYVTKQSVRIIQLSSLYKSSNYRGVRIIEASLS